MGGGLKIDSGTFFIDCQPCRCQNQFSSVAYTLLCSLGEGGFRVVQRGALWEITVTLKLLQILCEESKIYEEGWERIAPILPVCNTATKKQWDSVPIVNTATPEERCNSSERGKRRNAPRSKTRTKKPRRELTASCPYSKLITNQRKQSDISMEWRSRDKIPIHYNYVKNNKYK